MEYVQTSGLCRLSGLLTMRGALTFRGEAKATFGLCEVPKESYLVQIEHGSLGCEGDLLSGLGIK